MRRWLYVLGVLAGYLLIARVHAAPGYRLAAELGPELDSNATRLQQTEETKQLGQTGEDPVISGLVRMVGRGDLDLRLKERHLLSLSYGGGAKVFWQDEARIADELVHHGDASWDMVTPVGVVGLTGAYYDAYQRESVRDFRVATGGARLRMTSRPHRLAASLTTGYRWLQYKPNERYSFDALRLGGELHWYPSTGHGALTTDWGLSLFYTAAIRYYGSDALVQPSVCATMGEAFPCEAGEAREDLNQLARASISYLGDAVLSLWYGVERNDSTSYGGTYTRHAVGLKFTATLGWGVFLTTKGTLQLSSFDDPFVVTSEMSTDFASDSPSIDDENRSSLIVQFARDIDERWAVHLRSSLFVNEASGRLEGEEDVSRPQSFLRSTLYLGLRYELDGAVF